MQASWWFPDNSTTRTIRATADDAGTPIFTGLAARLDSAWMHYLSGTFGFCVANPVSEAQIAYMEVLQKNWSD
jgi:hypothetical protein